eukprot:108701-Amphidinium_carterae.1
MDIQSSATIRRCSGLTDLPSTRAITQLTHEARGSLSSAFGEKGVSVGEPTNSPLESHLCTATRTVEHRPFQLSPKIVAICES